MKIRTITLTVIIMLCLSTSISARKLTEAEKVQAAKYQRLAFVSAPQSGADSQYAPMILKEVERVMPQELSFLQKADFFPNAQVDSATNPPKVDFPNKADYDAVVTLFYYTIGGKVFLDVTIIDTKTWQKIWDYRLARQDSDIQYRLTRSAFLTPKTLRKFFYGHDN
jgi:hypothetical protein